MTKWLIILCSFLMFIILASCDNNTTSFTATVLENNEVSLLVEPTKDTLERKSSDKITVALTDTTIIDESGNKIDASSIVVGVQVKIYYNGLIAASYPAQINSCYKIVVQN